MESKNIKKFNGAKLIAGASSIAVLVGFVGVAHHISKEIKEEDEKEQVIISYLQNNPQGINVYAYEYALKNNTSVVSLDSKYYALKPSDNQNENQVLVTDVVTGTKKLVNRDSLVLLNFHVNEELIPDSAPLGGEYKYVMTENGLDIMYEVYDYETNEYKMYSLNNFSLKK